MVSAQAIVSMQIFGSSGSIMVSVVHRLCNVCDCRCWHSAWEITAADFLNAVRSVCVGNASADVLKVWHLAFSRVNMGSPCIITF
jgi:hypothetical protein